MSSFVAKKDSVIGTGSDSLYLSVPAPHNQLLREAIAELLSGRAERAEKLIQEWKEKTGRSQPSYSY